MINQVKISQTGRMISSGQVASQIPPQTIANGAKTTERQNNDHRAPADGQGVRDCLLAVSFITVFCPLDFQFSQLALLFLDFTNQ